MIKKKGKAERAVVGCQSRMTATVCGLAALELISGRSGVKPWSLVLAWSLPRACFLPSLPPLSPPSLPICCRLFLHASIPLSLSSLARRHAGKCLRVTSRSAASSLLTG